MCVCLCVCMPLHLDFIRTVGGQSTSVLQHSGNEKTNVKWIMMIMFVVLDIWHRKKGKANKISPNLPHPGTHSASNPSWTASSSHMLGLSWVRRVILSPPAGARSAGFSQRGRLPSWIRWLIFSTTSTSMASVRCPAACIRRASWGCGRGASWPSPTLQGEVVVQGKDDKRGAEGGKIQHVL